MKFFNWLRRKEKPIEPKWEVVIDPGHGGSAKGAVNKKYGYMEKDINLAVAASMRSNILLDWPLIAPIMTRLFDNTVSLPDRVELANYGKTDCFISIHSNARKLKGRYGLEIETFFYKGSGNGWLLAKEIQDALILCKYMGIPVIDRGVKPGKFYVLRKTAMPAVLVELGFLSDNEEAELLIKAFNQKVMAEAIVSGVVCWLEEKS